MFRTLLKIFAPALSIFVGACAFFSPDRDALKNLPPPDALLAAHETDARKIVSFDESKWRAWLADFSARNFSPAIATYAPGEAIFYGNGFSINFHEKQIVLNFAGEQFVCTRVPADSDFLKNFEKSSVFPSLRNLPKNRENYTIQRNERKN